MLTKRNRLTKKEFRTVSQKGKISRGDFLILRFRRNDLGVTRANFVISKRIERKAIGRNQIRRWLSEVFRNSLENTKKGFDLIFFARKEIKGRNFQEISKDLQETLRDAGLLL